MDKAEKAAKLRVWRDKQRHDQQGALPLPDSEMQALFDMLDDRLPTGGCKHTRELTDAWLAERGHPADLVHGWLDGHGGFCDCEVLANAEQAWREATGRA